MAEFKHGSITVVIPGIWSLSEKAGNLSKDEVQSLAKAAPIIAQVCEDAADGAEVAGPSFMLPQGVSVDELRSAAIRTRSLDKAIAEAEYTLVVLRQNRLLEVATSLQLVGQVNDQGKIQGKRNPRFLELFARVFEFFKKTKTPKKEAAPTQEATTLKAA
jgi:hypothetical protein